MPDLNSYKQGRDVMLSFDDDVGHALRDACLDDADDEAICLAKAADIIRRDMFGMHTGFDGSFPRGCQEDAVPKSLVALVSMIMDGINIKKRETDDVKQATLSLAQLLQYNSCVRRRLGSTGSNHSKDRETPLPVYIGMMIHGHTRKRELVDILFHLGLSISYDIVLDISMDMAIAAVQQYESDEVVCLLILRKNLFTTAAVDNLDHNPSSATAHDAFHGTGISLFQNRDTESDGIMRPKSELQPGISRKEIPTLPESYTNLTHVTLLKKDVITSPMECTLTSDGQLVKSAIADEKKWQTAAHRLVREEAQSVDDPIGWAAFHANAQQPRHFYVTITSLLPLFPDDSKSVAMIRHSMDVVQRAVHLLNPGQVPVLTLDQPLFTIAKQIQWNWPDVYGEEQFVILLGGLHIEMAALTTPGDFLDGSGWTHALTQADLATAGKAESFLKTSHVKRTRHAHQVTASALSILLHNAYDTYVCEESEPMPFDEWCTERIEASPQFQYWLIVMQLELLVLVYVRSLRDANFLLYVAVLVALTPWFFALDHTHYSRWVPIHIRDMMTLHERHPDIATQFAQGGFVVRQTKRPFSAIAINHAHEQNNKVVKGDGGAVDLLQNPLRVPESV